MLLAHCSVLSTMKLVFVKIQVFHVIDELLGIVLQMILSCLKGLPSNNQYILKWTLQTKYIHISLNISLLISRDLLKS